MRTLQELRAKRSEAVMAARKLVEDNPGDKWNNELDTKLDAIYADIDKMDGEIARTQRVLDSIAAEQQLVGRRSEQLGASDARVVDLAQAEKAVLIGFLRNGATGITEKMLGDLRAAMAGAGMSAETIQNTMSTTTPSQGGYTVPRGFGGELLQEVAKIGGVRDMARIITTETGAPIDWPTVDETSQAGELLAENAAAAAQDVAFGTKALVTYKFSSKGVAVPIELLQDTAVDLEGYIRQALADRLARAANPYYTTGTGTSQPEGFITNAPTGKTGIVGQTTSVIYDDLVDLIHSVDPAYRVSPNCGWMFNDSTLKVLRKLKDSQNHPLWQGSLTEDAPDSILGYRYAINQNMAAMAANAKSIAFGDWSKFVIRDALDIQLYRFTDSAYASKGQVGFLALMRSGSAGIHATYNAIKLYVNSAT